MTRSKAEDVSNEFSFISSISNLEDENRLLRESLASMEKELSKFRRNPLISCEIKDIVNDSALIRLPNGNEFMVEISSECECLKPGDFVLSEQKNLTVVRKIPSSKKFDVERFVIIEKPSITFNNVGGLSDQVREIKEVIELPLIKPDLFRQVGISPPKGVLLYGPPGTGKTLLAKAVANSTNATFIEIVGSELVQKFIGEGAKQIKEIFTLAREKAPSIIFIDEIDAIAATRIEIGTSGEREVQRTFMQLLAELDGFDPLDNVKIIGCTNRKDILDPAIVRPGRLDRLIFVALPDSESRRKIFKIHSKGMKLTLSKSDLDKCVKDMEGFSGAEIRAVVTEAGYFAIRDERFEVSPKDIFSAVKKVKSEEERELLDMFG